MPDGPALRAKWDAEVAETAAFAPSILDPATLDRAGKAAVRYVDGRGPLFAERIARGRVVDGHGDLLADDVFCLDDGPRILDCIEFDDALRRCDVLADVAFLAMDLERLGAPAVAAKFLAWYREFSGETSPRSLEDHYVAQRALIRSKVACLRAEQGDQDAPAQARLLLDTAGAHLRRARVRLVLVGGSPGTGKSTLASGIADALGWTLVRSDRVRKQMFGDQAGSHEFASGLYTPDRTDRTYDAMLRRARIALGEGESVVLDASWSDERRRADAARVAFDTFSDLVALLCTAPADVSDARLTSRRGDPSDATPEIAARMRRDFAPWAEAAEIDTAVAPEDSLATALRTITA